MIRHPTAARSPHISQGGINGQIRNPHSTASSRVFAWLACAAAGRTTTPKGNLACKGSRLHFNPVLLEIVSNLDGSGGGCSTGFSLCRSLNTTPKQPKRKSVVRFVVRQQPDAVRCKQLRCAKTHLCVDAALKDDCAGTVGIRRKRLAVFVAGGGSNFRSIHEAALGGLVHGDVVALVTDKTVDMSILELFGCEHWCWKEEVWM